MSIPLLPSHRVIAMNTGSLFIQKYGVEPNNSPWRAQVVVTHSEHHKKRMAIDYSLTINCLTLRDAYSLPRIDDTVNTMPSIKFLIYAALTTRSVSERKTNLTQLFKLGMHYINLPVYLLVLLMEWHAFRES